jgi:nicotinate-nucleotide pyrophosphorylase (carboxylating)
MFDQRAAETLIDLALQEDLADKGDITSEATLSPDAVICGQIVAKAEGILAGLPIIALVYRKVDSAVQVRLHMQDGDAVRAGSLIAEVIGSGPSVLSGERIALNFLQHLSGIATLTARFVQAAAGTKAVILDTRKTTPGWRTLEKYAVRAGGGHNHRIGLFDMVMIKDNHVDAVGGITEAVETVRRSDLARGLLIEVEVRTLDELREVLPLDVDRVLLDNMTLDQMRDAVAITGGRVPLEASGNMSLERVAAVAGTGVDFISVGALTHSAPALDLSMKIRWGT